MAMRFGLVALDSHDGEAFGAYYDPANVTEEGFVPLPYFTQQEMLRMAGAVYCDSAEGGTLLTCSPDTGLFVLSQDGSATTYRPQNIATPDGGVATGYLFTDPASEIGFGWKEVPINTGAIASAFCTALWEAIPAHMPAVEARNERRGQRYRNEVCASQDFCDANMVMESAINEVAPGLLGYDCEAGMPEEVCAAWNEAWGWAKACGFEERGIPHVLLARLRRLYPDKEFTLLTKDVCSEEDNVDVPDLVIAYTANGMTIFAPFYDCDGMRSEADSLAAYGIKHEDAEAIQAWNRILG